MPSTMNNTHQDIVERCFLLRGLDADTGQAILDESHMRRIEAGGFFFHQGYTSCTVVG